MGKLKTAKVADIGDEIVLDDGVELTVGDLSDVVSEIETEEAKREAYEAQPGEIEAEGVDAPDGEPKAAKAPRVARKSLLTHKASELIADLAASMGAIYLDTATGATLDSELLAKVDKLDKKAREKAVNLVASLAASKRPSVYTVQAVKALSMLGGSMTPKQLVDYYLVECGYKPGTARRQASEMFAVFPVFGIATRDAAKGSPLVANENSVIGAFIREVTSRPVTVEAEPEAAAA